MKPVEQARRTLSELVRGLIYPIVPILGVVCIWVYAYAGSLESKIERDLRPGDEDSYACREMSARMAAAQQGNRPVAGIHVTSIDDGQD